MVRTSGFVDNAIFSITGPIRRHVDTMEATSLQRRAQVNAPAAWCWLCPVLACKGCRGGVFLRFVTVMLSFIVSRQH